MRGLVALLVALFGLGAIVHVSQSGSSVANPKRKEIAFLANMLVSMATKDHNSAPANTVYHAPFVPLGLGVDEVWDMVTSSITQSLVVADIGANVGKFSLSALEQGHRVIAYEVDPVSLDRLGITMKAHMNSPSYTLRKVGLADEKGSISFRTMQEPTVGNYTAVSYGCDPMPANWKCLTLPITTMDQDLREDVDAVKIDIQGAEGRAFRGMERHLANIQIILAEYSPALLERSSGHGVDMLRYMASQGFYALATAPLVTITEDQKYKRLLARSEDQSFEEFDQGLRELKAWTDIIFVRGLTPPYAQRRP